MTGCGGRIVRSWFVLACLVLCVSTAAAQEPLDPQAYDLNICKGLIRFSNGQYSNAERLFRAALGANPDDSRASFYLGQTLIRLKRPEAAQEIFERLLRKNQDDGRAWLGLGRPNNRGLYNEALASLENAEKHLIYFSRGRSAGTLPSGYPPRRNMAISGRIHAGTTGS